VSTTPAYVIVGAASTSYHGVCTCPQCPADASRDHRCVRCGGLRPGGVSLSQSVTSAWEGERRASRPGEIAVELVRAGEDRSRSVLAAAALHALGLLRSAYADGTTDAMADGGVAAMELLHEVAYEVGAVTREPMGDAHSDEIDVDERRSAA
jgi:hypothetical protein